MEEKLFNFVIFSYQEYDKIDDDTVQYYDVKWMLEELKKYDNKLIVVNRNWDITIYKDDGIDIEIEFNLIEVESMRKLVENYKKEK